MKTLIVYDSFFGNTKQIAEALGSAIASSDDVVLCKANAVKLGQLSGLDLLIVGSPTRAFKPTEATTQFLNSIPSEGLNGMGVLSFDTRVSAKDVNSKVLNVFVKVFGYAAEPIGEKLKKKGGNLIAPPEGFIVTGSEGPLKEGELERASSWITEAVRRI